MNKRTVCTPRAAFFFTDDPAEALEHFRAQAEAIPQDEAPPQRVDLDLARHNLDAGLAAVEPHRATLPDRLLDIDVPSLWELPSLWKAAKLASMAVPLAVSTGEIDATTRELSPLREAALLYLEGAALLGHVPEGRVRAIREGSGPLDFANDCVAIAHLFRESADALDGRHLFTAEQLETLWRKGSWLVDHITPQGAPRRRARSAEGLLRDRLVKMLIDRHERLRALGGVLFGMKGVDEKVPPLFSRMRNAATEAEEAEEKPAAKEGEEPVAKEGEKPAATDAAVA